MISTLEDATPPLADEAMMVVVVVVVVVIVAIIADSALFSRFSIDVGTQEPLHRITQDSNESL